LSPSPLNLSQSSLSWSPDGIAGFIDRGDIGCCRSGATAKHTAFFQSKFIEGSPPLADGRWLRIFRLIGPPEVYVQPFPGPGAQICYLLGGGTEPAWARNARNSFPQWGKNDGCCRGLSIRFRAEKPKLLCYRTVCSSCRAVNTTFAGRAAIRDVPAGQ